MKHGSLKLCSIVLTIVMIFNMLPHQVLADTMSAGDLDFSSGNISTEDGNLTAGNAQIVEEVLENRTEFSKEYKMSDGLHMAVVYPDPVHYEKDGQWVDIDNTLVTAVSAGEAVYTNTAGVWNISLPQQFSSGSQVTITKDGYTLKFGMAGILADNGGTATMSTGEGMSAFSVQEAQTSVAQVQQVDTDAMKAAAQYEETVTDKLWSRLQYSNVYSNTNVIYDLSSNQLKESIVIGRYDSGLRGYQYTLDVGSMIPVLDEGNVIRFYDSAMEKVIMVMPAPFLEDAAGEFCGDVEVVLRESGNSYMLYYLLPQEWLAEDSRAWPVVLDPVVTSDLTQTNVRDITVTENDAYDNNSSTLAVGHNKSKGKSRVYLKYTEIPALTSADVIVSATVGLYRFETLNSGTVVEVHKVNGTWASESIKWATQPGYDETVEDFLPSGSKGYNYLDVTDIVREWYEGENTGMLFKTPDSIESITTTKLVNFYSSDAFAQTSAYRPALFIIFRNNNGLESYWDYTASSAGRAGTGYINNYTGNLVWIRGDMGFGGNRMPVSISHVYNTNDSTVNDFGMI